MKALVLEREGRRAVLLLPGGEMRTVRAKKDWETGMEVSVKPYPLRKKRMKFNARAVLYPLTGCMAAILIIFVGLNRLGGEHIDRQHPVQPLSSGSPVQTNPIETPDPSAAPQPTPEPTFLPAANMPDSVQKIQPTPMTEASPVPTDHAAWTDDPVQSPRPTPLPEQCDECGQYGHDDDHCPNEICDECGEKGHDDDHCPEQICDECGEKGHDDDHCPEQICEECGQKGHDDDHHDQDHHDD